MSKQFFLRALSLAAALSFTCSAFGQFNSNSATVQLNATLQETLTITATPGTVNFALAPAAAATGDSPVSITTTWQLKSTRASLKLYAWFATPSAALTDASPTPNNIPSSEVLGLVTTGSPTAYTAFTQTNTLGAAAGGLLLYSQTLDNTNRSSTRTDSLALKIDLTSQPQLPAGSYTGTLNLQAQAL